MCSKKVIIIISNTDWFFLLHRLSIANNLRDSGCNVIIAAKDTGKSSDIKSLGFEFINIDFDRKGLNPFKDLSTFIQIFKSFKKYSPHLVYQVTIKPIIYGSIIARFFNISTVNTICGLGYVFSKNKKSILRKVVSLAYGYAVNYKKAYTFFENRDDQKTFLKLGILEQKNQSTVVNGVGVDLNKFKTIDDSLNQNGKIVITIATRMLWDKGIKEFVEASKKLKPEFNGKIEFRLFGMIDKGNPACIPIEFMKSIEVVNYLKWFGFVVDMVKVFEKSDIVVLPSYREGLPTVLAEACAMGLPIVTTNAVGCKECVDEGVNGFKVDVKSVDELANAIRKLIINKELRLKMGKASREKAKRDFDQNKIVSQYQQVFNSMLNN